MFPHWVWPRWQEICLQGHFSSGWEINLVPEGGERQSTVTAEGQTSHIVCKGMPFCGLFLLNAKKNVVAALTGIFRGAGDFFYLQNYTELQPVRNRQFLWFSGVLCVYSASSSSSNIICRDATNPEYSLMVALIFLHSSLQQCCEVLKNQAL